MTEGHLPQLRNNAVRTPNLRSTIFLSTTDRSLHSILEYPSVKSYNCLMPCVMAHHKECSLSNHFLTPSLPIREYNYILTLASNSPFAPFFRTRKAAGLSACTPLSGNWNTSSLCASPIAGEMNSL